MANNMKLTYNMPAPNWTTGLFLGNGRLGAMLVGTPAKKRIALNHDRIMEKHKTRRTEPVSQHLKEIRRLIDAGQFGEAEKLLVTKLQPEKQECNFSQPAGDLHLAFPRINEFREYYRELDLDTAIATERWQSKGTLFECETFVSPTHQVVITHLKSDKPGQITGTFALDRINDPAASKSGRASKDGMTLICQNKGGLRFVLAARVIPKGGVPDAAESQNASLTLRGADEAWILLAIATSDEAEDPLALCKKQLDEAVSDLKNLKAKHVAEHRRLFQRASLSLGDPLPAKPVDQLVLDARAREPLPAFYALLFNYARYLLISSSRPGSWPAHEGGIWCERLDSIEETLYHFDGDLSYTYWSAEVSSLSECAEPLFDFIDQLRPSGRKAAKDLFGCRGVYFGIATDGLYAAYWRSWVAWTGAAAFIAQHFWQHWEYTQDVTFLRKRVYPFLKEVADFYLDFLIKDKHGYYITSPSVSPEDLLIGREDARVPGRPPGWSVLCVNATMDIALITEVFTNLLTASERLNLDLGERPKWRDVLEHLRPWPIDEKQGLRVFPPGQDAIGKSDSHSHLYGVFPGESITVDKSSKELVEAAKKSLLDYCWMTARSGGHCLTARVCLWARLLDREKAVSYLKILAQTQFNKGLCGLFTWGREANDGTEINFLPATNIGTMAGIAEMLLQSHRGVIRILPALPKGWDKGEAKGWRARGGFELNFSWKESCIEYLRITSTVGSQCHIKLCRPAPAINVRDTKGKSLEVNQLSDKEFIFESKAGETYTLF